MPRQVHLPPQPPASSFAPSEIEEREADDLESLLYGLSSALPPLPTLAPQVFELPEQFLGDPPLPISIPPTYTDRAETPESEGSGKIMLAGAALLIVVGGLALYYGE